MSFFSPSPPILYFPLAQQILSQADIGSWSANLLGKEFVVHSLRDITYFDIPLTLKVLYTIDRL